mmetsp:Transcript_1173/g.2906  ORF Transcript_1173/g.2906 Transcript_1173/m.2906 type:complete len:225 (+) Transcript_1173:98-772(+)
MTVTPDMVLDAFRSWDKDGSGAIQSDELRVIFRRLCPALTDEHLNTLFAAAAKDGGGSDRVRYEQFVRWLWKDGINQADVENADEAMRQQGLWRGALVDASARAAVNHPADKVRQYFDTVKSRLEGLEYTAHVKDEYFKRIDADKDGKVSFAEAQKEIVKSLQCAADLGMGRKPTEKEIRAAFDAHDTLFAGRGMLGEDEFLNLARYLQVVVAEAILPLSQVVR